jgi:hypothetical protein
MSVGPFVLVGGARSRSVGHLSWWAVLFWTVGVACVNGRRQISSWCRGWASPVRSVRKWLVVGGAFLDCGHGLCQWASPDFELVPWVGVAGAFGEKVIGGGWCFFGLWAWPVSIGVVGFRAGAVGGRRRCVL